MDSHVPLDRQFSPVPNDQLEGESDDIFSVLGHDKPKTWDDIDREALTLTKADPAVLKKTDPSDAQPCVRMGSESRSGMSRGRLEQSGVK